MIEALLVRLIKWWNRGPQPGDYWVDNRGQKHVLSARDDRGNMTTDRVRL